MELLKKSHASFQNHEQLIDSRLLDKDFTLISRLTEIIKILEAVLMYKNLNFHSKFEIQNAYQILETILKEQNKDLKPTTIRLKNLINTELMRNKDGDGVIVRIIKCQDFKLEKCSLINFYIYGN